MFLRLLYSACLSLVLSSCVVATEFRSDRPYPQFQVGATGLLASFESGAVLTVEGAIPGAPAFGKLEVGDIVESVNGLKIEGNDPRRPLGEALLEAESTDGNVELQIKRGKKSLNVAIKVPVLGQYSDTWPLDCKKSEAIVKQTAEKLIASQQEDGSYQVGPRRRMLDDLNGCMASLFLMSTGEAKFMPAVKRHVLAVAARAEQRPTMSSWHLGYQLMVMGEYYLKTGDKSVLPAMNVLAAKTAEGQIAGSWGHSMNDTSVGYVQSGQMNSAGVTVLLGLAIARECGVTVSEDTFQKALLFFYRMPGHGSICYGDHRSEIYIDTNGRNAAIVCAMGILPGENYRRSAEHLAMLVADSYCAPEAGHTGGGFNVIWRGIGTMFLPENQQHRYRRHMDQLAWFYTLCRLPDGGFKMMPSSPSGETRYTGEDWGYSLGLTYTAPRRNLRILGGKPTQHSVLLPLPELPWGTPRDLDFFRTDYCDGYGNETESPDMIYKQVHGRGDADLEVCVKEMRHFSPMFRTWAAQKLASKKTEQAYAAIQDALTHTDVRVRRAGCDAISSYTNWGRRHTQVIPREVVSKRFVPHLESMLKDPEAAWWEIDGALWALAHAEPADIRRNMPIIKKYAEHEEWYLRESAYWAIVGLQADISSEEFLYLGDRFVASTQVFERSSYDGGINSIIRSKAPLDDATLAAYARKIGQNIHSSLLATGYDETAAHHEATHRTMMVLKHFKDAPYVLIQPDFVKYMETWRPGIQHSDWLIVGSKWQLGLVEVAKRLEGDAGPLIASFEKAIKRCEWNERDTRANEIRQALEKAVADYRREYGA